MQQYVSQSVCVCVCLFPNSSKTADPNEVKLKGMFTLEIKDTILRSTINDYLENEPDGRLTAWVYPPPLPKTLPL